MRHFLNLSDAGGDAVPRCFPTDRSQGGACRLAEGSVDSDAPLAGHVPHGVEKNSTRTVPRSTLRSASSAVLDDYGRERDTARARRNDRRYGRVLSPMPMRHDPY